MSIISEEQKEDCPIGETNLNIIKSNIGYGIIEMKYLGNFCIYLLSGAIKTTSIIGV